MITAALMLLCGIMLSAFFSGTETGFYRVNRVRLLLDSLAGNWTATQLLKMTNNPAQFVATVLVGNNCANYLVSLGTVLGTQSLLGYDGPWVGVISSLVLTPFLFVYGESLPKQLFHDAPNRLLRKCGFLLVACTWIFWPVTILMGGLSKLLQKLTGESLDQLKVALARKELQEVFDEGHEAGIIRPAQQGLAQGLFALAHQSAGASAMPATRMPRVKQNTPGHVILELARRWRIAAFAVEGDDGRQWLGYVRVIDVHLSGNQSPPLRPLLEISASETYISALNKLYDAGEQLGRVVGASGETVGFVTKRHLAEPLFRAQ